MSQLVNISRTIYYKYGNMLTPIISRVNSRSRCFSTYFTPTHEWVTVSDDHKTGTIGITKFAERSMGDIVFCELPSVGDTLIKDEVLGILESVKASSDIHTPVSGSILEINTELEDNSSLVNTSTMDDGWLVKINIDDITQVDGLLSEIDYKKVCDDIH